MTIVPTHDAAGSTPINYFVSGMLRYVDNGLPVSVALTPAPITVLPQPELYLRYFWQRDVISDDPFTPEIKPANRSSLGLWWKMKAWVPRESARIRLRSVEIIDNEKELLVNFQIIATQVMARIWWSLTTVFGQVDPGQIKIARWFMTSTIQGLH